MYKILSTKEVREEATPDDLRIFLAKRQPAIDRMTIPHNTRTTSRGISLTQAGGARPILCVYTTYQTKSALGFAGRDQYVETGWDPSDLSSTQFFRINTPLYRALALEISSKTNARKNAPPPRISSV